MYLVLVLITSKGKQVHNLCLLFFFCYIQGENAVKMSSTHNNINSSDYLNR
jgi:hypothetical protein